MAATQMQTKVVLSRASAANLFSALVAKLTAARPSAIPAQGNALEERPPNRTRAEGPAYRADHETIYPPDRFRRSRLQRGSTIKRKNAASAPDDAVMVARPPSPVTSRPGSLQPWPNCALLWNW